MSGNSSAAPASKIHALTVSVNYADYLECIAPNRKHFERWLVVTDESDLRTREVCARFGMDVLFATRLYQGGAAFNKAAALNEGLAALDPDAWVAVLDSDILLPPDFRTRLDVQSLDPRCLYGLAGRRICATRSEFQALAPRLPWADNLVHATFIIGYFNLFHPVTTGARYPEDRSDDASAYDMAFSDKFPAPLRRNLPFVCLHAGTTQDNWRGRTTDPFMDGPAVPLETPDSTAAIATRLGGPGTHAVQIGCYRGEPGRTLAVHFSKVSVIDHWGLSLPSPSPALERDRQWLLARYESETAGISPISAPLEHSARVLDAIPDASLDLLWLTAEPEYDFLLQFLPAWLPKLKPGGALAGGFYDPELLPVPSRQVQLLLGEPDLTYPDRQWVRILPDPAGWLHHRLPPVNNTDTRGVVYIASSEAEVEPLLVSLSSLRHHWHGAVCVLNPGDEIASLRLLCARLRVMFRNIPAEEEEDLTYLRALSWSPFEESAVLGCATLVRGPLDWLFEPLAHHSAVFCGGQSRPLETTAFAWRAGSFLAESWLSLTASLLPQHGPQSMSVALLQLLGEGLLYRLPPGNIWSGPARRIPHFATLQDLSKLAGAGAVHLYDPWQTELAHVLNKLAGARE